MSFSPSIRRWLPALLLLLCCCTTTRAANYYWIGNAGNWSDISHWATVSGGTVTHAQAPTADDDVFFDANSFTTAGQTVTLNTDVIFCRSMDWTAVTNAPALIGADNVTLNVFGSFLLGQNMRYELAGRLRFTGAAAGSEIDVNGRAAAPFVYFNGTGDWTLTSALRVDSVLFFQEGTLRTNGHTLNTGFFRSSTTARRTLDLGASEIIIRNGKTPLTTPLDGINLLVPLNLVGLNLRLMAGTSVIRMLAGNIEVNVRRAPVALNELRLEAPRGTAVLKLPNRTRIRSLDLAHNATLEGDLILGTLRLYPGQQYRFGARDDFQMDRLIANGGCGESVGLSSTGADPARFSTAEDIRVSFVTLRNITARGRGSFTAESALDLGGTDGWVIDDRVANSYYWVGGSGVWDDLDHWSATSGGPPAGCLPSLSDSVFFDANSFTAPGQVVRVNVTTAACGNMDWTGAAFRPTFDGPATSRVRIGRSLTFVAEMDHPFAGDYVFTAATPGHVVTSAGQRFNRYLTFESGGGWRLGDDLYVHERLLLNAGSLVTAGHTVNVHRLESETERERTLDLGNSVVNISGRGGALSFARLEFLTSNLDFRAGGSVLNFLGNGNAQFRLDGTDTIAFNVVNLRTNFGQLAQRIDGPADPTVGATFSSLNVFSPATIKGTNRYGQLRLSAGGSYELEDNREQIVTGALIVTGDCNDGLTSILSAAPAAPAGLRLPAGNDLDRLLLRNIAQTGPAAITATNTFDGAGNAGWTITPLNERTLYWVGGTGEWYDPQHWSLRSGGAGGECVPTPVDNVFFDGNSSGGTPFTVFNPSPRFAYCNDITWTESQTDPMTFEVGFLRMGGSFVNRGNLNNNSPGIEFFGTGTDSILTGGAVLGGLEFRHFGTYTLVDDLTARRIRQFTGTLLFRNERARLTRLELLDSDVPRTLDLGEVELDLELPPGTNQVEFLIGRGSGLTVVPGRSRVNFTGLTPRLLVQQPVALHQLRFTDPRGEASFSSPSGPNIGLRARLVAFNGDADIAGTNSTDSLIFASGKNYVLQVGDRQRINRYWQTIGNNCTPISLQSSTSGQPARVLVPDTAKVLADFIQMRDIQAAGGNEFRAGARSTDIGNSNPGWLFETAPRFETIGFLGGDRTICDDGGVTISAYNFSPGETYAWSDGSTEGTLSTSVPGTYSVVVTFGNGCAIEDEVVVVRAADFSVDLPDDPVICAGDSLVLTADAGLNSADYRWSNGSTDPTLVVRAAGAYGVVVDLGGCVRTDSLTLTVNDFPELAIDGPDVTCAGDSFTLRARVAGATEFAWQGGTLSPEFSGNAPGTYFAEAANGGCAVRDSFRVTYVTPAVADIGGDTVICAATALTLTADYPGYDLRWQDGSGMEIFVASRSGRYTLTIDTAGCRSSDTVSLSFTEPAVVRISGEPVVCSGNEFTLSVTVDGDAFRWQDGSTDSTFSGSAAGVYFVDAFRDGCGVRDSFEVASVTPAPVNLGADTTLCTAESLVLSGARPGYNYVWQDGSTNATYLATRTGRYFLTRDTAGCMSSDTIALVFPELPAADITTNYESCEGQIFSLTTALPADAVRWSNGQEGADFTTGAAGTYTLELDFGGCTVAREFAVAFRPPPALDLGPDETGCVGEVIRLNANRPGVWQDGSSSDRYEARTSGLYTVLVTDGPCTVADTISLTFAPAPDFSLGADRLACVGDSIELAVRNEDLESILWNDGVLNRRNRLFATSGRVGARITDANGCSAADSVSLSFQEPPRLSLPADTTHCDDRSLVLKPGISGGELRWPDGSGAPQFLVREAGPLIVELSEGACVTRDTILVTLEECVDFQAYLPTGFSPNADGVNDGFGPQFSDRVEVLSFRMEVYDRWGALIFRSDDPGTEWDGTRNGQASAPGVYVYAINLTYRDDRGQGRTALKGDVMLLR